MKPEQIAIPKFSAFVEYGEVDGLKEKIDEFLIHPQNSHAITEMAGCYSKKTMTENYLALYQRLTGEEIC